MTDIKHKLADIESRGQGWAIDVSRKIMKHLDDGIELKDLFVNVCERYGDEIALTRDEINDPNTYPKESAQEDKVWVQPTAEDFQPAEEWIDITLELFGLYGYLWNLRKTKGEIS